MTTLIEQAVDAEGWTVGQAQQLKNVQMCPARCKSQQALLQLLPRGDMSIRVPFAPSVFRGAGEETCLSIIFEAPASVVEHMQKVEATITEKSRSLIPNIDALWSPCMKPTLHGPQLRCKLHDRGTQNTAGQRRGGPQRPAHRGAAVEASPAGFDRARRIHPAQSGRTHDRRGRLPGRREAGRGSTGDHVPVSMRRQCVCTRPFCWGAGA